MLWHKTKIDFRGVIEERDDYCWRLDAAGYCTGLKNT